MRIILLIALSLLLAACGPGTNGNDPLPEPATDCTPDLPSQFVTSDGGRTNAPNEGYPYGITIYADEGGGSAFLIDLINTPPDGETCWRVQMSISFPDGTRRRVVDEGRRFTNRGDSSIRVGFSIPEPPSTFNDEYGRINLEMYSGERGILTTRPDGYYSPSSAEAPAESEFESCEAFAASDYTVVLGARSGADQKGDFTPFGSNLQAEVLRGFQGADMITPAVQLEGSALEDQCVYIALANYLDDAHLEEGSGGAWYFLAAQPKGGWASGPIFDPIWEMQRVINNDLSVEVTAMGKGFWLQQRVAIPVVDRE